VDVQLDGSEPLLLARFDFVHTLRVLVNLIENALKYAPEGVVEVAAHRAGDVVEIVVADRGPGIAPAERDRVFEPFYRPATGSAGAAGAGLGLSIARSFADAQGGSVRYEAREGGGSRLVVTLPAVDVSALPAFAEPARESL
jgi:two-component system sensor histidine kinase KdpD